MATVKSVLDEGIRFFRQSKRIEKALEKIERKLQVADVKAEVARVKIPKAEINKVKNMLKGLAKEFKKVERDYREAKGDKEKKKLARQNHKNLKEKYKEILKLINDKRVIQVLQVVGILGIVLTIASMGLSVLLSLENVIAAGAGMAPLALSFVGVPYLLGMGAGMGASFLVKNIKKMKDQSLLKLVLSIKKKMGEVKAERMARVRN